MYKWTLSEFLLFPINDLKEKKKTIQNIQDRPFSWPKETPSYQETELLCVTGSSHTAEAELEHLAHPMLKRCSFTALSSLFPIFIRFCGCY